MKNYTERLRVDKRIVDLLSRSTYQKSFSCAIRELVSNAYDADALSVKISISYDYKNITIEDDGNGMSESEFKKFLTIAGNKTNSELSRKYKRKRIGQFGVGFLAIFPFCDSLEIVTSVENSDEILTARIPTLDFSDSNDSRLVEDISIPCKVIEDKNQKLNHFTRIRLIDPNYRVIQYFTYIETRKRDSILTYNSFQRFTWELQEDLPISFDIASKSSNQIQYEEPIGIDVFVNSIPLYRNDLQDIVLDENTVVISGIVCKYIFTTSYKSIRPLEARGIKRRVNNVGIGPRTDFELRRDRGFSRLHWIAGEIHFSEKIKEHLTISRDSFLTNPIIDEINEVFAEKLRNWAYYIENVAVAEKEIMLSINDLTKGSITPKDEIISKNIKKLEDRGFKVIREDINHETISRNKLIELDKKEKTILIYESAELTKELLEVNGTVYEISYSFDSFIDPNLPCRIIDVNHVIFNQNYHLFRSKTYGTLFKRLHVFLAIAQMNNLSANEMYQYIIENFRNTFDQYK
jgi:hypothetical protein